MSRNSNEIDHGCGFGFLEGTLALISKKKEIAVIQLSMHFGKIQKMLPSE